jgi:putative phosphoribosyl transferase
VIRAELKAIIQEESDRLAAYQRRFHPGSAPALAGKAVLLVDDGLATGATTEAAVLSVRKQSARTIMVAAPVASTNAVERLAPLADEVRVLCVDPEFNAVGQYYDVFAQTTDEEVLDLLRTGAGRAV